MRAVTVSLVLIAASGCSSKSTPPDPPPTPVDDLGKRVGIDPDRWTCDVLTTPAVLAEALGAPAHELESGMPVPPGVAKPCNYLVEVVPGQQEAWSYDLDCRDGALKTAEILFTQYAESNAAVVAAYADASAGKPIFDDAGVALVGPGGSFAVAVGKRGLDHHGQGILFVDDDAPCYVRVVGRDPARRLTLAKLVAQKLTPATAPMRPRYTKSTP